VLVAHRGPWLLGAAPAAAPPWVPLLLPKLALRLLLALLEAATLPPLALLCCGSPWLLVLAVALLRLLGVASGCPALAAAILAYALASAASARSSAESLLLRLSLSLSCKFSEGGRQP
jgi:hypothetical protein